MVKHLRSAQRGSVMANLNSGRHEQNASPTWCPAQMGVGADINSYNMQLLYSLKGGSG